MILLLSCVSISSVSIKIYEDDDDDNCLIIA